MYRTKFTFEILSEEPVPAGMSIEQITFEAVEGNFVAGEVQREQKELTNKQMADALYEVGSDPNFFNLDDLGNKIE